MKYLFRGYIIAQIIIILIWIGLFILSFIIDNIMLCLAIMIVFSIACVILFYKVKKWYLKKNIQLSHEKFTNLKNKDNKTLYEQLYIKAYNDSAISILTTILETNNINNLKTIDFDASFDKDYITLTFEYKHHKVYYYIYENKVVYYIDSPEKYDYLEINKEYEKKTTLNIQINKYDSLENFFALFINNFNENIQSINNFEDTVNVVAIDSKTKEEIIDYRDYIKSSNILLNILSIILIIMMVPLTYFAIKDYKSIINEPLLRIILLFVSLIALNVLAFGSFIYSIYGVVYAKKITNDFKYQNIDYISGKPVKIKFIKGSVGSKRAHTFCCGVKLYFNDPKKVALMFTRYFDIPSYERQQKIKNSLLNTHYELIYFKNTKLIINGMEKYRKKLKK